MTNKRYDKLRILRQLYSSMPNAKLAEMLGMTTNHVHVAALRMGLRKDPKYLSDTNRKCAMKRWAKKSVNCPLKIQ